MNAIIDEILEVSQKLQLLGALLSNSTHEEERLLGSELMGERAKLEDIQRKIEKFWKECP